MHRPGVYVDTQEMLPTTRVLEPRQQLAHIQTS